MNLTLLLLVAGVAVVLAGALVGCLPTGRRGEPESQADRPGRPASQAGLRAGLTLQAAGAALIGIAGAIASFAARTSGAGFHNGFSPAFGLDRLSGSFLVLLALVAAPACLHARDGLIGVRGARALSALTGLFILAMTGLLVARDAVTFLAFWEAMTLLPAAMILIARSDQEARQGAFYYVALTHIGGAGTWVAMLVLARHGALAGPQLASSGTRALVIGAALVGFGTKAGMVPLHTWLPRAHPLAPPHASALMSGVMVKLALYGLMRVLLQWAAPAPLWTGLTLLALGALSAVSGVLYALFQRELKRLLAFCTVENVGVILLGLGAAVSFAATGHPLWAQLAFGAALLQTLSHGLAKGLLFLAAGSLARQVGSLQLDRLGGLLRQMPWTGAAFLTGAVAIAGIPPLGGFASEWLTLEALVHLATRTHDGVTAAGALAGAALAATAALAALCFAAASGLVLLGRPRRQECADAREVGVTMRGATTFLAACCVALALVPGLLLPHLAALVGVAAQQHGLTLAGTTAAQHGPTLARLGLDLPLTGNLPAFALVLTVAGVTAVLYALSSRAPSTEPSPAWACGQETVPELQWTLAGFTKPIRLMFDSALRTQRALAERRTRTGVLAELSFESDVPHLFDTHVAAPLVRLALRVAGVVRRLQSGSLHTYLGYLVALVIVLVALLRFGALG